MIKKPINFVCLVLVFLWEYSNGQVSNYYLKQWDNMKNETSVSFANANVNYAKNKIPEFVNQNIWKTSAWKGEQINTKILIWSKKDIQNVSFELTDLRDSKGNIIPKRNINLSFMQYVWTDGYFGNGCFKRNNRELDSSLVADLIDTLSTTSVKEKTVQPVWVSIKVPGTVSSGIYSGHIQINAETSFRLDIELKVLNHILPPASSWSFDLDLWQYPVSIAKAHKVDLWSDKHFELMKPYYRKLASAGQKVITISMIEGGNQSKDVSPAMIKWIRKKDETWKFDYTLFDKYVSFVMDCGIRKRINCFTMVPWSMEFSYYDEALGRDSVFVTSTTTDQYKAFWKTMLADFSRHLKEKNWFDKTSIAMDERKLPDMLRVIAIIKEVDPAWKITLAGSYHPELVRDIDDYSIFKTFTFSDDELKFRNANKMSSTFYTSCEGEKPNMFTFSPPGESLWMAWYAAAKGFSGYLRWAYNLWNENPLQDSRGRYPAGDFFQIYPGPKSSVRFEKLVEGIQDFEKLRIIREEYSGSENEERLKPLKDFLNSLENELLDSQSAGELISKGKQILNKY